MDKFLVIFTSDLHGNKIQYEKLFQKAIKEKANAIILGGDLTPKDSRNRTIEGQRRFLKQHLFPRIKRFFIEAKNKCNIFAIMGNDDFRENESLFENFSKYNSRFKIVHQKSASLEKGFKIYGYPFVPPTPFKYKDWEKIDTKTKMDNIRSPFILDGINNRGTIKQDLQKIKKKKDEKLIIVSHAPPYNTTLDMVNPKFHVGSIALRKFLEDNEGFLSLHGHIHETVENSGKFTDKIGKNICITSGNSNESNKLALIKFNLFEIDKACREII